VTTKAELIDFGEWLPDLPDLANPGATEAKNTVPEISSYSSLADLQTFTTALTGQALGSYWAPDDLGGILNFAGDSTKLYTLLTGDTWDDVSRTVGGVYSAGLWDFAKFGSRVIAADDGQVLQYFDVDAPSTEFEDLPNAPTAKYVGTVRDFVVAGNIPAFGSDVVGWSGFNNSEQWDLTSGSLATQSDRQELFGRGGEVMRVVPGEYGLIFQKQAIQRMDYVGPPLVFQFDEIERKRGTPASHSVTWFGSTVYYFGWDGFYRTDGSSESQQISANRVSQWFLNEADSEGLDSMRAAIDRERRLVMWAFRTSQSSAFNNRLIMYNWVADKWSWAEVDTEIIAEFVSPGFVLDALDTPLPGGIDADSINVDSDAFTGGQLSIMGFATDHKSGTFDGTPLVGTLDTKEISGADHQRLVINSVRPLYEGQPGSSVTIQVGTRNRLQDNVNYSSARSLNAINGEASVRINARYPRFRLNITGGFDKAIGVRANVRKTGGRA